MTELQNVTSTLVINAITDDNNTCHFSLCSDALGIFPSQATPSATSEYLLNVLHVLQYVNYVILPTFLVLGLFGNVLTIVVMTTKRYLRLTSRYILIALACSDTVFLSTQPFNKMFVMNLLGRDYRALSDISCKLFFIIFKTSKMTSSWFVVFLCLERFTAVWFPLKAKFVCTKRTALFAISTVYLAIGTYTCVWSYSSQIVDGVCFPDIYDVNDATEKLKFGSFLITALSFYSIIPTFIMGTITPLIIIKLTRRTKLRRKISAPRAAKTNSGDSRITVMLLGVVLAYIILILPVTMLHFLSFVFGVRSFGDNAVGFLIFRDVSQILEQLNYAINFFLYVMTSRWFREGILDLLCNRQYKTNPFNWSRKSWEQSSVRKASFGSNSLTKRIGNGSGHNKQKVLKSCIAVKTISDLVADKTNPTN